MYTFIEHVPSFVDGKPEKFEFKTLKELLSKMRDCGRLLPDYVFAYGNCNYNNQTQCLMISSTKEKKWWVLGYVTGLDLAQSLTRYDKVYKLQGRVKIIKVKIGKSAHRNRLWVVENERNNKYSLVGLKNPDEGYAWVNAEDCQFMRYATQAELDRINNW